MSVKSAEGITYVLMASNELNQLKSFKLIEEIREEFMNDLKAQFGPQESVISSKIELIDKPYSYMKFGKV